ncbi:hypothetical protein KC207_10450 [Phycicoccus sp. BSK3Z-2]|uniref:Uncharacterized protein n=1 Tax=Phycicoccus avicenniae TaxID=2828860 RepID=A0A941D7W5_9MICO|nr:hypothetical protein [Phycicoccus avicenniae]MBR7743709.1 hypothetical protein [Phycicoccus avicenniae]
MRAALVPLGIVLLPGLVYVVLFELIRWAGDGEPPRVLRPLAGPGRWVLDRLAVLVDGLERVGVVRRDRPEPVPPVLLALELRRLAADIRRIDASDMPHRAARLSAAFAAYDSVLVDLCRHADLVPPVGLLPLHPRERLALEADLVASGVDW